MKADRVPTSDRRWSPMPVTVVVARQRRTSRPPLAGAFRLGGDVDAAFDFGVERLADALERARP